MNIRKYKPNDKIALIELWETVFPDDPPHNNPSIILEEKLKVDDLIFITESNSEIVGACMAGYDGHRGWLYAMAVSANHRRAGIATKLVLYAMQELKHLGCLKVNLQIRSTNHGVAAFYQSLGFVAEDRLSMGAFIE
jgi:ribosomal protein S18 acetylase RimI-like enzyme